MDDRKPPVKVEPPQTLVARSVRLAPRMWTRLEDQARIRGFDEVLVFVRKLIEYALSVAEDQTRMEASVGMPSRMLAGSRRPRRF